MIDKSAPDGDAEWLLSRAALQRGDRALAIAALARAKRSGATAPAEPAPYIGSARCAECHSEIHDREQSSRHSRTFHHADQIARLGLPSQTFTDPNNPEVTSAVNVNGTSGVIEVRSENEVMRAVMKYLLGSGRHAFTAIGHDRDDVPYELRLTYYPAVSSWDRTPGHAARPIDWHALLGERQTPDSIRRCLNCHTTNHRAVINKIGPESLDRGIGCERCHGPGGNHVAAVEASLPELAIKRFRRNTPGGSREVIALCGACHGAQDRPIDLNDPATSIRFQATTLTWSKCYEMSRDTLDCLSCHSAHGDLEGSTRFYEAKCLSCHAAPSTDAQSRSDADPRRPDLPRRVTCPVNARNNCVTCHMPKVPSMMHAEFTDHHIRIHSRAPLSNRPGPN